MNPFKSLAIFGVTVWTTLLTSPSWWGEWYVYGPFWLVILSWLLVPLLWLPGPGPARTKWLSLLLASWLVLAVALVSTRASDMGVFWSGSGVLLLYCLHGMRHLW